MYKLKLLKKDKHILWLASWYPNPYQGQNGDFVQRHAHAVGKLLPIHVIHVAQAGHRIATQASQHQHTIVGCNEQVICFNYRPTAIGLINSIIYNYKYFACLRQAIKRHIASHGKPNLVHVHIPLKAGLLALWLKLIYKIPFVVTEHSSFYLPQATNSYGQRNVLFKWLTKTIFSKAKAVTCVSDNIGQVLQQLFPIQQKLTTIYNVVNEQLFYALHKPIQQQQFPYQFIHVSSLLPLKNPELILEAFAKLQTMYTHCSLTMVGPFTDSLMALSHQLGINQQVRFTGEVEYTQVAKLMQQADSFILFSKHENFPCVIIEALCCGLTVVSSDVGGIAEAVHAQNGILVPEGNVEILSLALYQIIKNNKQYNRKQIAEEATNKYSQLPIAQQFLHLYNQLL